MRIFSLYRPLEWRIFLCLSIVLGLLAFPLRVLSQEDPSQYIHLNKTVKEYDYATKKGTLSLEAFVEGEITKTSTSNELEVVLILDLGNSERLTLMKNVSCAFVDSIQAAAVEYDKDFKIGVVSVNVKSASNVIGLTSVRPNTGATAVKTAISGLTASASHKVATDIALNNSNTMLNNGSKAFKTILFMTGSDEVNNGSANGAISASLPIKSSGMYIYSLGLFPSYPTGNVLNYLEGISSNFLNPSNVNTLGTRSSSDYFYNTYSEEGLSTIIDNIEDKVVSSVITGGAKVILREDAYLQDVLTEYFSLLPGVADGDVRVYYSNCTEHQPGSTGYRFEGKYEITASVEISGTQTVQISGLDYSAYWCGYNASAGHAQGRKFIVEIPFYLTDFSASPLTLPTNTADSGIFGKFEGESAYTKKKAFTVPSIAFANLSIQLTGLKAGDASRFKVTSDKTGGYDLGLMLRGVDASGSVTSQNVYRLEPGTYTVTESSWPWKYTPQGATSLNQDISVSPTFEFSLQDKESLPMNDEATKRNLMHP